MTITAVAQIKDLGEGQQADLAISGGDEDLAAHFTFTEDWTPAADAAIHDAGFTRVTAWVGGESASAEVEPI